MSDVANHDPTPIGPETPNEVGDLPGIIRVLSDSNPADIITEKALAHLFQRHPVSIKRAVRRGELPPPCRLFGGNAWTVGVIISHIEKRLEEAAKEMAYTNQKIARLSS